MSSAVPRPRLGRSIRSKIFLAFLGMSVITGALGLWGIAEIHEVGRVGIETYDRPLMAINYARAANTTFEQLANPTLDGKVTAPDADDPEESFLSDLDVVEARASSAAAVKEIRQIRDLAHQWLILRNDETGQSVDAALQVSNQLRSAFDRLIERMAADGFANRREAVEVASQANGTSATLTTVAVVASLLLTFLLSHRIVRPLTTAASAADRIAGGEFDAPIPKGGGDEAGVLLSSMTVMQDRIGEMVKQEKARRRFAEGRLVEGLESSTDAMLLLDRDGIILVCNSRTAELLGSAGQGVRDGDRFVDAVAGGDAARAARLCTPGELPLADGRWLMTSREETVDGNAFLVWRDITQQKVNERRLEVAAYEDPLTGVHNRIYFLDRLEQLQGTGAYCVVVVNIDRFHRLNSAYGRLAADQVLVEVAGVLRALIGPSEYCARIDGDEFALLVDAGDPARLSRLLLGLGAAFPTTLSIGGRPIAVQASVGVAQSDGAEPEDLLVSARAAQEQANRAGGNCVKFFDAALRKESRGRARIEAELPDAIRNRDILLHYQPLIELKSGRIAGFEALSRWKHPELGFIPPGRFVPIAEEGQSILALGKYVLETACGQIDRWVHEQRIEGDFTVAVNLSPRQMVDPTNAREILDFLDRNPVTAHRLKLEVTEGILLDDPAGMIKLLQEFKERGVELSLDDFGTGFSSLSYLHRYPFDVLKIDRSFVIEVAENDDALRLVRTIIELGRDLGMKLVAEGIETAEQAKILQSLGCHIGQGYYFSKPAEVGAATLMLERQYGQVAGVA